MVDDKFSQALAQSAEIVHAHDELQEQTERLKSEKEKAKSEFESALEKANKKTNVSEALLTEEPQKHIDTLQKFRPSKQQELTAYKVGKYSRI
ncbi:MAG: hypothetical protein IJZ02_09000 [Clostridia bacterium]|nr:hypothetical protein [Clostridia bacterium]